MPAAQHERPVVLAAGGGLVALVLLSVGALVFGTADVPWRDCLHFLWVGATGGSVRAADAANYRIVIESRLPRVILAILVGAGLAVVGVLVQAMVRNALADPYVLGISSGASVGATAVVVYGVLGTFGVYALSLSASIGALAATALVYQIARTPQGLVPLRLVLVGTAVGYGLSAVTTVLVFLAPNGEAARSVMFWLLGSLGASSWDKVPVALAATLVGIICVAGLARQLNALSMGDEVSASLGLHAGRFRVALFVLSAAMTGCFVSICGAIGFVGLVIPHAARLLVGADHRRVLIVAPVLGACFLVAADLVARTMIPPQELPLGAITAAVGVPVFVGLMRRRAMSAGAVG
ncbi:FecCD family ABC transporter permease [Mycobacteroides salmoniphilum]|uniref:FecCD family ABC transporter permease n=1 Tax=Mycobacteroides salmoniphilum TaxID=404941 RepID=UPI00099376B7|nr:iron ABC transporter permease [Mycobacteroides salmoniphilum]QCH22223.1 Hemin transport system permease protein HmuU [Mycobacteroides salmoniphilum]